MKTRIVAAAAALLAVGIAGAAQAQDFQPKAKGTLILNARISQVAPDVDDPIDQVSPTVVRNAARADVTSDVMPTLGLTYFLTDKLAVEVIAGTTKHTIKASGAKIAETWVLPPVVSLQYHPMPADRISPYVGAGLNYMLFYSGKNTGALDVKVDDGVGYALQAGVDFALDGKTSLNLDVKKVFFETDVTATAGATVLHSKASLDPWVISAGVGYRF